MNWIGNKISETRKIKGLTQEELADQANINLRTIQRIEKSESEPRGKTLNLICEVLEIDSSELLLKQISSEEINPSSRIVNGLFLLVLNLVLMGIIGFLTLDSNANVNSVFGGYLVSIFIPFSIVVMTKKMSGVERMLQFGFGYIFYFVFVLAIHGFPTGFVTGLFPCLLLSLSVLYFGNVFIKNRE